MLFPKPESRARTKARAARQQAKADKAVYAAVAARDGGCCRVCGARPVELHHVVYRSQGGQTTPENLVSLCRAHHRAVHARTLTLGATR